MIYMGSLSAKRHNSPASPVHSKVTTLVQEQWKERHHPSVGLMALSGTPQGHRCAESPPAEHLSAEPRHRRFCYVRKAIGPAFPRGSPPARRANRESFILLAGSGN